MATIFTEILKVTSRLTKCFAVTFQITNRTVFCKCLYQWLLCVKLSVFGVILVRISPYLDCIRRRDTEYLSVFSLNAGKYRPEKTPYLDTFHRVNVFIKRLIIYRNYARFLAQDDHFFQVSPIFPTYFMSLQTIKKE